MNKNIDMKNIQNQINDKSMQRNSLIMKIEKLQREIQQLDLEIKWLHIDGCSHNLVESPELVWIEDNCGEVVFKEEWKCTECFYKELREVE